MYLVSALLSFRAHVKHTFCFQLSLMKPAVCLHLSLIGERPKLELLISVYFGYEDSSLD